MVDVQMFHSGILAPTVEHVGDLIHRMSAAHPMDTAGYEYVREKVNKCSRWLSNSYGSMTSVTAGFEREHADNIRGNSAFKKMSVEEYVVTLDRLLSKYARAHQELPVYNQAQFMARSASVALGECRWADALLCLSVLKGHLASEEEWVAYAHSYIMAGGVLQPFNPQSARQGSRR